MKGGVLLNLSLMLLAITAFVLSITGSVSCIRSRGSAGGETMRLGQMLGVLCLILLALSELL